MPHRALLTQASGVLQMHARIMCAEQSALLMESSAVRPPAPITLFTAIPVWTHALSIGRLELDLGSPPQPGPAPDAYQKPAYGLAATHVSGSLPSKRITAEAGGRGLLRVPPAARPALMRHTKSAASLSGWRNGAVKNPWGLGQCPSMHAGARTRFSRQPPARASNATPGERKPKCANLNTRKTKHSCPSTPILNQSSHAFLNPEV